METQELKRIVEALIFAADEPLSGARILETLELKNGFDLEAVVAELNREYQESGRAFTIRQVAGGYQIATQPDYANWIRKLYLGRQKTRLSQAALETLALIAFKQPISRVEIAQIRGVNSDGVIGTLLERKLITISGRSEGVGRPLLYGTTPEFLKYFGLNDLADLPKPREIEELFGKEGMPEELLQALSQTEAQLSLPIHVDGETASVSEDAEKIASTAQETKPAEPPPSSELSSAVPAPVPEDTLNEPVAAEPARPEMTSEDALQTPDSSSEPQSDETDSDALSPAAEREESSLQSDESGGTRSGGAEQAVDERRNVPPEILVPQVEEQFETSTELPAAKGEEAESFEIVENTDTLVSDSTSTDDIKLDESTSLFPFADDDQFATTSEIVLFDNSVGIRAKDADEPTASLPLPVKNESISDFFLVTPPTPGSENIAGLDKGKWTDSDKPDIDTDSEVDSWLAEEFADDQVAEPDFLLQTEDLILDALRKMPVQTTEGDDFNGKGSASLNQAGGTTTALLPSSILDEIFQESDPTAPEPQKSGPATEATITEPATAPPSENFSTPPILHDVARDDDTIATDATDTEPPANPPANEPASAEQPGTLPTTSLDGTSLQDFLEIVPGVKDEFSSANVIMAEPEKSSEQPETWLALAEDRVAETEFAESEIRTADHEKAADEPMTPPIISEPVVESVDLASTPETESQPPEDLPQLRQVEEDEPPPAVDAHPPSEILTGDLNDVVDFKKDNAEPLPQSLETPTARGETSARLRRERSVERSVEPLADTVNDADLSLEEPPTSAPYPFTPQRVKEMLIERHYAGTEELPDEEEQRPTFQERAFGWVKRTFQKILTLFGARL
jgi:segregation and condensation protein B